MPTCSNQAVNPVPNGSAFIFPLGSEGMFFLLLSNRFFTVTGNV